MSLAGELQRIGASEERFVRPSLKNDARTERNSIAQREQVKMICEWYNLEFRRARLQEQGGPNPPPRRLEGGW